MRFWEMLQQARIEGHVYWSRPCTSKGQLRVIMVPTQRGLDETGGGERELGVSAPGDYARAHRPAMAGDRARGEGSSRD